MIETLKFYKNFPKEGINFIDIIPFLQSRKAFSEVIDRLNEVTTAPNVAAPEARAFLFAAPLLTHDGVVENIIPMRKSGKLPFNEGDLIEVKIVKEYGFDRLYYRLSDIAAGVPTGDTFEVTILDDVLATGGTAEGVAQSLSQLTVYRDGKPYKVRIKEFVFLVGIPEIGGRERLEKIAPVTVLMEI
jgi:adenine phosphoribosyltransferase